MLVGSVTISRSMPRAAIAVRVLTRRCAYSARSKGRVGWSMDLPSGAVAHAAAVVQRACKGEVGYGGVLRARAGEVADRDVGGIQPARALSGDHLPELGKLGIARHQSGIDRVVQLAQRAHLRQPVADISGG